MGKIVERVSGQTLDRYLEQNILGPLGMKDTAFKITPSMRARLVPIHQRGEDGSLQPTSTELPQDPEFFMGGGGLYLISRRKRSKGKFTVLRQSQRSRLQAELVEVKAGLRKRMHDRPEGVTPFLFQEPGSKWDHAFGHQASDSRLRNEPPRKLILKNLQVSSAEQRGEKGK